MRKHLPKLFLIAIHNAKAIKKIIKRKYYLWTITNLDAFALFGL
jgi:hypothetical protein